MSESVSFDRVAALYDSTRVTDEQTLRGVVDLLEREVATGTDAVLEIGVGTGALAVPLSARGVCSREQPSRVRTFDPERQAGIRTR